MILKHLPDDSPFKDAYREDWSQGKYIDAGVLNELRLLRVDQRVIGNREGYDPNLVKSPRQQEIDRIDSDEKKKIRDGIREQLNMR